MAKKKVTKKAATKKKATKAPSKKKVVAKKKVQSKPKSNLITLKTIGKPYPQVKIHETMTPEGESKPVVVFDVIKGGYNHVEGLRYALLKEIFDTMV